MAVLCFVLIMQISPQDSQPGSAADGIPTGAGILQLQDVVDVDAAATRRNPFQRYSRQQSSGSAIDNASGANIRFDTPGIINIPTPAVEINTRMERITPPVLRNLRAILIVHGKGGLALFGSQVVAVSDTIAGFTVTSISFDKVVLTDGLDIIEESLGASIVPSATKEP